MAADVADWHGGKYLQERSVKVAMNEGDLRWRHFEETRSAARANMAATRDLAEKLRAGLGVCEDVVPALDARVNLKPVKCERCRFYQAKLAGWK